MSNIHAESVMQYDCDVAVIGSGSGALPRRWRPRARRLPRPRSGEERICRRHDDGRPALPGLSGRAKRPTVGGIATEFVERLRQDNASFGVRYCPKHCSIAAIDPDRVKLTAAKFLEDSGVDFLLHTHAIAVEVEDGVLRSIRCECAGTRIQVRAKVFIDATGDGVISLPGRRRV